MLHEVEQVCDRLAILFQGQTDRPGQRPRATLRTGASSHPYQHNEAAISVLNALDWVGGVKSEVKSLIVSAPPERSWELTPAFASHDIYVSEMNPIQKSLEWYFLEVTGDDEADHGEDAE